MKVGIFSPYWDTLGGGEWYAASVAKYYLDKGHEVELLASQGSIVKKIEDRFGISLSGAVVDSDGYNWYTSQGRWWKKFRNGKEWGALFVVSDGSVPLMFAKTNILHFQVPFKNVGGNSLVNKWKLGRVDRIVCNSEFTRQIIENEYQVEAKVIYPPVKKFTPGKKEKLILSVGRFDNLMQSKRHDVLIDAFNKLNFKDWRLILAGGVLHGKKQVIELKKLAGNRNVQIETDVTFGRLKELYARASIYWHAAGYGVNEQNHPEKMEHFGVSTVEAMSAGCIPVVFDGGGLKEIVRDGKDGYRWRTVAKLVKTTKGIMKSHEDNSSNELKMMGQETRKRAEDFSERRFGNELTKIVS